VHIELVNGDLLGIFKNNSIDIIVSNPPYVSEKDFTKLEKNVKNFEPRQALVSEDEGLYTIKQIVCNSKNILKKGGWLLIEIGYDQTEKVIGLFRHHGFKHIESIKDISGIDRVIKAQWIN
jgi:release factor glutamine methyltransferase